MMIYFLIAAAAFCVAGFYIAGDGPAGWAVNLGFFGGTIFACGLILSSVRRR